jgi:transposase
VVSAALLTRPQPDRAAFAKIKHWMRAAQKRTVDELWRYIGGLVSTIQARECSNYFANAGYASIKL